MGLALALSMMRWRSISMLRSSFPGGCCTITKSVECIYLIRAISYRHRVTTDEIEAFVWIARLGGCARAADACTTGRRSSATRTFFARVECCVLLNGEHAFMGTQATNAPKTPSLGRAIELAGVLVGVDAFLLNQGGMAFLVGAVLLLVGLPRAFLPRFRPVRWLRLRNLAVYFAAVMLVFVFNVVNNRIAHARAEQLVTAVKAYHAKYYQYPPSLDALVPEFIESVPRAKYTLIFGTFLYANSSGRPFLFYVAVPPFGRPTYSFATDQWTYRDCWRSPPAVAGITRGFASSGPSARSPPIDWSAARTRRPTWRSKTAPRSTSSPRDGPVRTRHAQARHGHR